MKIQRDIFTGYCLLTLSISLNFIYIGVKNFDAVVNADAYNYWRGHSYLVQNPFDVIGNSHFGRFPEYIYDYLFSIIGITGRIQTINAFAFITALPTYILIFYCYSNITKVYCTKTLSKKKGLLLQMLAVLLPVGLTIQTSRQAFAFFLFLSLVIALRRTASVRTIICAYVLASTHVGSMLVLILEYFTRNRRILSLSILILLILIVLPTIINRLTHIQNFELLRVHELQALDRYYIISIFCILFFAGTSTFTNWKLFALMVASILILMCTPNAIVSRIFFGYSWLWLILLAWSISDIREWSHLRLKVQLLTIVLIGGKMAYIFSETGVFL